MRQAQMLPLTWRSFMACVAILAMGLGGPVCRAQDPPAAQQPENPFAKDLNKYPGLLAELGQLLEKLQNNVQFPPARTESRLLPLLPKATISYGAFSNYGSVARQALTVFRQELKERAVLRDWWEHGAFATGGPKVMDALEKFEQLHQYLGEEIVVSGALEGKNARLLMVAEIRKPGLKEFLLQMIVQLAGKSKPGVRVLDLRELGAAKDESPAQDPVVLVRPDFAVLALDLDTLRSFNARLDAGSGEFVATPFGKRAVQEYKGGLTLLAAADLYELLNQLPTADRQGALFQRTGFADLKYYIWEHKSVGGKTFSQSELSFTDPRHGAAAWLAKSGPMGSLEFASPGALLVSTLVLGNPAQIFEDINELARLAKANPFAGLAQLEQGLKLNLKDDLLSLLSGELTLELDKIAPPLPVMKAMLGVKDAGRLQQTLGTLLAAAQIEAEHQEDAGLTYHVFRFPANPAIEICYAFVDQYLVIGSGREVVADAVQLRRSGASLAKSKKFLAALPPGHSPEASALLYQDAATLATLQVQRLAPELAQVMAQGAAEADPVVVAVYGDDMAVRQATTNPAFDAAAFMVVAAIAIPNLLRARITANEASAVGTLRSINTAQVVYATNYPQRGHAPNLAALGPDPRGGGTSSPDHADLLDATLANPSCAGEAWCAKSGYNFRLTAVCRQNKCTEYVAVAKPITPGTTGVRSFCSTSEGVIRVTSEPALPPSLTAAECQKWPPIS